MCFLALCNLEVIKNLTLKFKRHLCCRPSKNVFNEKLEELFKLEAEIDTEMHKLHDSIHKFKNELDDSRKKKG